jgi:hypothetical protein
MTAAGRRNPSISTARAQAWCRFTQVIHMLMHSRPAVLLPRWQPAADQRAGVCMTRPARRTRGPGAEEIVHEGEHRWPPPLLPDKRLMYSPPAGRPHPGRLRVCGQLTRHHGLRQTPRLIPYEPGCRRGGLARLLPLRLPAFARGADAQGPRPSSVMTADHRGDAFRRSPTCRTSASAGAGYSVPAGQNQTRPLHV